MSRYSFRPVRGLPVCLLVTLLSLTDSPAPAGTVNVSDLPTQSGAHIGCSCAHCCAKARSGSTDSQETDSPDLAQFVVRTGWPQPGGKGSPLTITYSYNNFLDGGLKDPDGMSVAADYIRTVVEEAFGLWASVAPLHFVEVFDIGTPVYVGNTTGYAAEDPNDFGQIRLHHRYINGTDAQNGMPVAKAVGWYPTSGGNISGDIHLDNGDPWAVVGTSSEPDILGVVAHEIGHAIGIDHSLIEGTVMYRAALRRMGPGTGILHSDDIAAVRELYGEGVGSVTPLPEPLGAVLAALAVLGVACGNARWQSGRRMHRR